MAASMNIAAVAHRTGVAAATLRKWEERYGVLRPDRTAGGQRRYDDSDVERVRWLRERLAEGYRIGEAAALLQTLRGAPPATPGDFREALFAAVVDADVARLEALLEQAFSVHPLELALEEIATPLLQRVGVAWADGAITIAQEHAVTACVRAWIDRLLADPRQGIRGTAVLACVPSERHELGLLMLAAMLRADGWGITYLGADTPGEETFALAHRTGARVVCLSVSLAEHLADLSLAGRNGYPVFVGGAAAEPEAVRALGGKTVTGGLRSAVRRLRTLRA